MRFGGFLPLRTSPETKFWGEVEQNRRLGPAWQWPPADRCTTAATFNLATNLNSGSTNHTAMQDMAYGALGDLSNADHSFSAIASSKVVYFQTIVVGGFNSIVPIPFVANSPSTV